MTTDTNTPAPTPAPIRLLHDWPELTVRARSVSAMDNNVFLITLRTTGEQVLIDAADDADAIDELINSARGDLADTAQGTATDTRLIAVVTTHQHWDHVRALKEIVDRHTDTLQFICAGTEDAAAITEATGQPITHPLDHGAVFSPTADLNLPIIGLRGHTPGSIALVLHPEVNDPASPAMIFTGDSLFPGGVGNTQNDPDRFASLFADVTERVFDRYDDATVIHPGHGDSTTLGAERPHLGEWKERGW